MISDLTPLFKMAFPILTVASMLAVCADLDSDTRRGGFAGPLTYGLAAALLLSLWPGAVCAQQLWSKENRKGVDEYEITYDARACEERRKKAEADPKLMEAFDAYLDEAIVRRQKATLGLVDLGYFGEFIITGEVQTCCVLPLISTPDGGLRLGVGWPEYAGTYATISPSGRVEVVDKSGPERSRLATPAVWPFRDTEGKLSVPPPATCLAAPWPKGSTRSKRPPNTLGWFWRDITGMHYGPEPGLERFDNGIWVVREGSGLQLVHIGPQEKGVYATVSPERVITYTEDPPGRPEREDGIYYWPIEAQHGRPSFYFSTWIYSPWHTSPVADVCPPNTNLAEDSLEPHLPSPSPGE